jgi:hypothetical protein
VHMGRSRDEERVGASAARLAHDMVRQQAHARGAADRAGLGRDENCPVSHVPRLDIRLGKDIERTGDVEELHPRHREKDDRFRHIDRHGWFRRYLAESDVFSQLRT